MSAHHDPWWLDFVLGPCAVVLMALDIVARVVLDVETPKDF